MTRMKVPLPVLSVLLSMLAPANLYAARLQTSEQNRYFSGQTWELIQFRGHDGKTLIPEQRSQYTVAFAPDGGVSIRIDCNRGHGTWKSSQPGKIEFGPMALTRAMCPPAPLNDRLAKDWTSLRRYNISDGHLQLLQDDDSYYEFEIADSTARDSPVASRGPFEFMCSGNGASPEALKATYYATEPGLLLLQRGQQVAPAFQVRAASGAKYEGRELSFWEAHGEAQIKWGSLVLHCQAHLDTDHPSEPDSQKP